MMSGWCSKIDLRSVPQMESGPWFCRDLAACNSETASAAAVTISVASGLPLYVCGLSLDMPEMLARLLNIVEKYFLITDCVALRKFV